MMRRTSLYAKDVAREATGDNGGLTPRASILPRTHGTELDTVKSKPGRIPASPPRRWRPGTGIYVIAPLQPSLSAIIGAIQAQFDPKLARVMPPHITIVGSSGAGPIAPTTTSDELLVALGPIAASTPPMTLALGNPVRFMQTEIIVLPLRPYGPLRELHERIRASGLTYAKPRFAFTPHITLSFYRQLSSEERRAVLAIRIEEPAMVTQIEASLSNDPQPAHHLLSLPLGGAPPTTPT